MPQPTFYSKIHDWVEGRGGRDPFKIIQIQGKTNNAIPEARNGKNEIIKLKNDNILLPIYNDNSII